MDSTIPFEDEQPQRETIRKRDIDATDFERLQLYGYSQKHSKATQKELSQWFYNKFKKQINQSTVSRRY